MINWYEDEKLKIEFDNTPCVGVRYATPSMTEKEIKSIKKFPFINKKKITVRLIDRVKGRTYQFDIPKGYCYDGASIPRFFQRVIGAPTDNEFLIAALVHDVLCENHQYVLNNRSLSTDVFNALLKVSEVGSFKRFLMKNSVACFQTLFCDWRG